MPIVTVVGPVRFERSYYVCGQCSHAPNPVDAALGVENQEFSPGVRRMTAVAGSDSNFDLAREQIELLAGIKLSTKSVERHAEQIGAEIRRIEQAEINRSVQLPCRFPWAPRFRSSMSRSTVPASMSSRKNYKAGPAK